LAYPELRDLQEGVPGLSSVALLPTTLYGYGKVLTFAHHDPIQIESAPVSHDFFRTLGVHPSLGRDFRDSDEHPGSAPVVVLSDSIWTSQFHRDPQIVGRQITLNGTGYTVIGVARRDVDFPKGVGLWVPLGVNANTVSNRNAYYLQAIARVKQGYSAQRLDAEVQTLFHRLSRQYPQFYSPTQQAVITDLSNYWLGSARLRLLVSLAASFLLLLSGCVTASNLLLSRSFARRHEIALRCSLGASSSQIVSQFLAEGLLIALAAGAAGVTIAWALLKVLVSVAPSDIPRLGEAGMSLPAIAFTAAMSAVVAVTCSIAPAWLVRRVSLEPVLRESESRITTTRQRERIQGSFVAIQTMTSSVLLVSSILMLSSMRAMMRAEIGFSHLDTVTMNVAFRGARDDTQRRRFYSSLIKRLQALPQVSAAAAVLVRPLEGSIGWDATFRSEFDRAQRDDLMPVSNFEVVTPGYFGTVGTPLLQGRDFTDRDREKAPKVVIISSALAAQIRAKGHEPLGTRIRLGRRDEGDWWTIIGVTASTRYRSVTASLNDIYVCYLQTGIPVNYVVVRGPASAGELSDLVRREVSKIDALQAVANVATISELVDRNTAQQRFNTVLLVIFGLSSLLLMGAGVFSVIAEAAVAKTREIGIRLALGAARTVLVRRFVTRTIGFVLAGEAVGAVGSVLAWRALSAFLYGIRPTNPVVLTTVLGTELLLAGISASVPAWIAAGQNPSNIIR